MNKEALEKLTDGKNILLHVSDELTILAHAFDETGNEKVADKLYKLSESVKHAREPVNKGTGEALSDALRASEEATGNMLRAALAGVLVPRTA